MYSIRKNDKISEQGLNLLSDDLKLSTDEKNPDGILLRSYKLPVAEFGDKLLAIARAGAGVNNIPVDECSKKGIVVFNTPGANANAVKELVIAGLLMSSRKLVQSVVDLKAVSDRTDIDKKSEKMKSEYIGPEISGKTLGIVGLGAIGVMVAQAAVGLNMKVIGYDPFLSIMNAWNIPSTVEQAKSLDSMLAKCDYISFHIPVTEKTKNMINSGFLSKMKDGVRILNFARGELVSVPDMVDALNEGKVACYVNDFADERLLDNPKVITFPHLGASTPEAEDNCAILACRQIEDYLKNGNITNSVNYPALQMDRTSGARITVLHLNKNGMIQHISDLIAKAGGNIKEMANRSNGDYAYTILDLDKSLSDSLSGDLEKIEGVIRVRIING